MLLQREGARRSFVGQSKPIRESADDRLYLTKKKSPLREDDDVIIDFDDDVDGLDVDRDDIKNLLSSRGPVEALPACNKKISGDIQSILLEINDRLANIEDMLREGSASSSSQKVTVTTQQTAEPVNESLVHGDIMSRLRPPQNVIPESSMLGEIQAVLAQQASMSQDGPSGPAEGVSSVCTLPNSAYDDEVPCIEGV